FLHRYKWMTDDAVVKLFGQEATAKLTEYHNFTDAPEADYEHEHKNRYTGHYRQHNSYLIVHTVMEDNAGERWSIYWHDDYILRKDKITFKKARWPYRVQRIHTSEQKEYYGIFREVIEAQKAINTAVVAIALMASSEKVLVEEGSVEDLDTFTKLYNRVNAIVPVLALGGVQVKEFTRDIMQQYTIIDKALDRIQQVLGVNDSFMGMAYASDSGRKVKLQQNAAIMSLHYVSNRIKSFYQLLGEDIANLAQQYYTAHHVIRISDELVGQRWIEIHKPMQMPNGKPVLVPQLDPASLEPVLDENGDYIYAPVSEEGTDIAFTEFEIELTAAPYNDEDEKAQLLLETMLSGQVGVMMSQVNPAGFFKMSALTMKSMKTKYSPHIAEVLEQTAQMLGGDPAAQQQASMMAQGTSGGAPKSRTLKLPTNTNEGVE
ncbi:MAG: hypothetical protein ACRCSS_04915, partial [Shewanella sp.]